MSNPCSATTCLNGNCPGCVNSQIFCNDPRCYPNCAGCSTSEGTSSNWVIVTIILVLLGVLLVMGFIIGYSWYKDRQKANEPKTFTVNKHTHTVVPSAPTIVTSPMVSSPTMNSTMNSPMNSPMVSSPMITISTEPISYKGVDLTLDGIPKTGCNSPSL